MTEILTESFCERCGTRYTFETSAPRQRRLSGLKVLGRGLKTFVLSDDTSLDEAFATARSDEERQLTSRQLDAFHKTFNFCMSCRQYTCATCWNPGEARCLSCAPWPDAATTPGPYQLGATIAEHEHAHPATLDVMASDEPMPPEFDTTDEVLRRLGLAETADAAPVTPVEVAGAAAVEVESQPEPAVAAIEANEVVVEVEARPPVERAAAVDGATDVGATAEIAAQRTTALLGRFRPGQSLDDEIAAYEASIAGGERPAEAEPVVAAEAADAAEVSEPVVTEPAVAAEPAVVAEPTDVTEVSEPVVTEPVVVAEPAVAAQPAVAAEAPAAPRRDEVKQPAWPASALPVPPPGTEPQWPTGPRWPTTIPARPAPTPGSRPVTPEPQPAPPAASAADDPLAFLTARRAGEAMWAASTRDVVAPAASGTAAPATVRSCVSCGLSLSATARFCRRCGSPQGS